MRLKDLIFLLFATIILNGCITLNTINESNSIEIRLIGDKLLDEEKYIDAIKLYKESIALDNQNYYALLQVGISYYYLKNFNEAENFLNKAIAVKNNDSYFYYQLGRVLIEKKEYNNAIEKFKKGIEINNTFSKDKIKIQSDLYLNYGISQKKLNNLEEAELLLKKALTLNPKNYFIYKHLGELYFLKKMYIKAIDNYEESIKLTTNQESKAYDYNHIGLIYIEQKDTTNAKKYFELSIKNDKILIYPYNNIAKLYFEEKNLSESEKYLNEAFKIDPLNFISNYYLGRVYLEKKEFDNSKPFLLKAVQVKSDDTEAWYYLALNYFVLKETDDSLKSLNNSLKINSKNELSLQLITLIYALELKDAISADKYLNQIPKSSPYHDMTKNIIELFLNLR